MRASRRGHHPSRPVRLTAVIAGLVLVTTGCFAEVVAQHEATSPATRPWFCNATGDGTPVSGHGNGSHVNPIYEGMTKGPLSWADCHALADQFDVVFKYARQWPTRGAAEAAGWRPVAQYIAGLGTHHSRTGTRFATTFDIANPQFLIYGGHGPDAPLAGISFALYGVSTPPAAFAGTNDWWHLHKRLCISTSTGSILAGAEEITDAACTALGGTQQSLGSGLWLLHLWIIPGFDYRPDVFSSGHPCLLDSGPAPASDPCWAIARRDPALGPPPTEHDHTT